MISILKAYYIRYYSIKLDCCFIFSLQDQLSPLSPCVYIKKKKKIHKQFVFKTSEVNLRLGAAEAERTGLISS